MTYWSMQGGLSHVVKSHRITVDDYMNNMPATTEDTKTAWFEVAPSTSIGGYLASILIPSDILTSYLVDIAIGASGSEVVIIENLVSSLGASSTDAIYGIGTVLPVLPIYIPAGTRIAARVQKHFGSAVVKYLFIYCHIIPASSFAAPKGSAVCNSYGTNTSTSGGTSIDPGAVANTKGAWTQFTASCNRNIRALFVGFSDQRNTTRADLTFWRVDVGIGSAGNEVVIIEDIFLHHRLNARVVSPSMSHLYPINIPAGTRISLRCQCTHTTNRTIEVAIYCLS